MELIPADSDYSLWSAQKHGNLPGLDVAFLLDASAYHTPLDTPERIRPGTVQVKLGPRQGGDCSSAAHVARPRSPGHCIMLH